MSERIMSDKIEKTEEEWKKTLTPEQYHVLREKGTERAFTGEYADAHDAGTYKCAACGNPLFSSDTKYESGSGWPSFYEPVAKDAVETETDRKFGMARLIDTELSTAGEVKLRKHSPTHVLHLAA